MTATAIDQQSCATEFETPTEFQNLDIYDLLAQTNPKRNKCEEGPTDVEDSRSEIMHQFTTRPPAMVDPEVGSQRSNNQSRIIDILHNKDPTLTGRLQESTNKKVIGVIGSGDYGRAISGRIAQYGYTVLIGSRDPSNEQILEMLKYKPGTKLVTQESALSGSDVIIIAINSDHYNKLPCHLLAGKILIDVANVTKLKDPSMESQAEILQRTIPEAHVVKAFNVLSAYALENNVQQNAKQVPVASNHQNAKEVVLKLVRELGYTAVDKGNIKAARDIEAIPVQLLPEWQRPLAIVLSLWTLHYIILLLKYQICGLVEKGSSWNNTFKHLGLLNFNRATAITAIWTLSLCYLPGVMAAYTQLIWGTKYRRFPKWFDRWLRMRKQLGLLMLALATVHTILGVAVWSGRYDALVWEPPTVIEAEVRLNSTTTIKKQIPIHTGLMNWQGELFLTIGTLSMILTCILGVSSLPSVGATLTWREFTFIQSKLGWAALLTATSHNMLLGWGFKHSDYMGCSLPSGAQYALHVPIITILLKIPLILPCVDNHLQKIRRGHERNYTKKQKLTYVFPQVEGKNLLAKRNFETEDLFREVCDSSDRRHLRQSFTRVLLRIDSNHDYSPVVYIQQCKNESGPLLN